LRRQYRLVGETQQGTTVKAAGMVTT
jgi:hypothetical protein